VLRCATQARVGGTDKTKQEWEGLVNWRADVFTVRMGGADVLYSKGGRGLMCYTARVGRAGELNTGKSEID